VLSAQHFIAMCRKDSPSVQPAHDSRHHASRRRLVMPCQQAGPSLCRHSEKPLPTSPTRCRMAQVAKKPLKSTGGACGGTWRSTSRCGCTRPRTWIRRGPTCSASTRTASCASPPGSPSPPKPATWAPSALLLTRLLASCNGVSPGWEPGLLRWQPLTTPGLCAIESITH